VFLNSGRADNSHCGEVDLKVTLLRSMTAVRPPRRPIVDLLVKLMTFTYYFTTHHYDEELTKSFCFSFVSIYNIIVVIVIVVVKIRA